MFAIHIYIYKCGVRIFHLDHLAETMGTPPTRFHLMDITIGLSAPFCCAAATIRQSRRVFPGGAAACPMCCMDTAYVRENPSPKQPEKGTVPPFFVPETLEESGWIWKKIGMISLINLSY